MTNHNTQLVSRVDRRKDDRFIPRLLFEDYFTLLHLEFGGASFEAHKIGFTQDDFCREIKFGKKGRKFTLLFISWRKICVRLAG